MLSEFYIPDSYPESFVVPATEDAVLDAVLEPETSVASSDLLDAAPSHGIDEIYQLLLIVVFILVVFFACWILRSWRTWQSKWR